MHAMVLWRQRGRNKAQLRAPAALLLCTGRTCCSGTQPYDAMTIQTLTLNVLGM